MIVPMVPFVPAKRSKLKLEDGETLIKTYSSITYVYVLLICGTIFIGLAVLLTMILKGSKDGIGPLGIAAGGMLTSATTLGTTKIHLTDRRLFLEAQSKQRSVIRLAEISELKLKGGFLKGVTVVAQAPANNSIDIHSKQALQVAQEIQAACSRIDDQGRDQHLAHPRSA